MKPELTWLQFAGRMRRTFEVDRPVKVQTTNTLPWDRRITPMKRWDGETLKYDTHYKIRINSDLDTDDRKEVLMHEWAHVLAWPSDDGEDHSDIWGKAYALVYRTAVSWGDE